MWGALCALWQVVALGNCRGGVERRTVVHTERLIGPSAAFYGGGGSTGRRHCVLECACKTKTDKTLNKVLRVPDLRRTLRDRRGAHPPLGVAQSGNPEHPRRDCHNGRLYKHVKGCSLPRPGQRPRPVQCQPDSLRRLISPLDHLCALSLFFQALQACHRSPSASPTSREHPPKRRSSPRATMTSSSSLQYGLLSPRCE